MFPFLTRTTKNVSLLAILVSLILALAACQPAATESADMMDGGTEVEMADDGMSEDGEVSGQNGEEDGDMDSDADSDMGDSDGDDGDSDSDGGDGDDGDSEGDGDED